uniref:Uncharacterized protein n=1 Tax=Megaviridae environmental sample TaxID=1737588 RepID=A0A5J6VJ84_9VIRU|nr:MAG: hypothetical protein [Megaviridae environmental sample]
MTYDLNIIFRDMLNIIKKYHPDIKNICLQELETYIKESCPRLSENIPSKCDLSKCN